MKAMNESQLSQLEEALDEQLFEISCDVSHAECFDELEEVSNKILFARPVFDAVGRGKQLDQHERELVETMKEAAAKLYKNASKFRLGSPGQTRNDREANVIDILIRRHRKL